MRANILEFNDIVLLVVDDVFVDDETATVTSLVSRGFAGSVCDDAYKVGFAYVCS